MFCSETNLGPSPYWVFFFLALKDWLGMGKEDGHAGVALAMWKGSSQEPCGVFLAGHCHLLCGGYQLWVCDCGTDRGDNLTSSPTCTRMISGPKALESWTGAYSWHSSARHQPLQPLLPPPSWVWIMFLLCSNANFKKIGSCILFLCIILHNYTMILCSLHVS